MIRNDLVVENARVIFKNFAGAESKFNRAGMRNFNIIVDREQGEELAEQGWNMKIMPPRDEDEEASYKMQVSVQFGKFPPEIYMIKGRRKIRLDEDTIGELDHAEVECWDIVIRPYNWELPSGATGVKAYVRTMYVKLRSDRFAEKYDFLEDDDEMPY